MPAPLVGLAVGAVARLAAKKAAQEAAKKVAKKTVTKAATKAAKANARGLKAAQGKSLASPIKKATAKVNSQERAMVKRLAEANKGLNMKEPYATKNAMRLADEIKSSKSKTQKASAIVKNLKNTKAKNNKNK
jgi:hypothetical protein